MMLMLIMVSPLGQTVLVWESIVGRIVIGLGMVGILFAGNANSQDHHFLSGTYLDPAQQRLDFLPHTLTNRVPEYRQVYNRPRYIPGYIAHKIEPSSQEAMAWETNSKMGTYKNHAGAYIPMYCYPKPWEALNTAARANTHLATQGETANKTKQ